MEVSMSVAATVFVIDQDSDSRSSVCAAVKEMGVDSKCFANAEEFFASYTAVPCGCIVTTYDATDELKLMREFERRGIGLPVIVTASSPPTALTVQVMKQGAISVLEKPCHPSVLKDALREAIDRSEEERLKRVRRHAMRGRIASLSEQERKVMDLMVRGFANKVIAKKLNVSLRTVESRRHEVFTKMEVKTVAELVRNVVGSAQ